MAQKSFQLFALAIVLGALIFTQSPECKSSLLGGITNFEPGAAQGQFSAEINGATGQRFKGEKVRDFPSENRLNVVTQKRVRASIEEKKCTKWVVVTTIFVPSEAIAIVTKYLTNKDEWCMVVVGDTKTPATYIEDGNLDTNKVVYLNVEDQNKLAENIPFVSQMPYKSFARKNVGYLYAIIQDAKVILDLDDDNELILEGENAPGQKLIDLFTNPETQQISMNQLIVESKYKAFNPFPLMGAPHAWPRGFPLAKIKSPETSGTLGDTQTFLSSKEIGVVQSVCNHDPDVDAIYRLTKVLPFDFPHEKDPMMIPSNLYASYNAQATLHFPNAYWGTYLPFTVTGRVSDIWRSYIVQRLLREVKTPTHLVYSPPFVVQHRNAHDYIGDMAAEDHLYMRTDALLEFLDSWEPPAATTMPERIQDLWIQLYERRYIEMEDVMGTQEFMLAMQRGGYKFPEAK